MKNVNNINQIYKITNRVNNKIYIGQTWNFLHKRLACHVSNKKISKLTNAIKKYGKENFIIECILLTHTQFIADYWEQHFINKFDSIKCGYNIKDAGSHGLHSEATKREISKKAMGHKRNLGKIYSAEHRQKISDANKISAKGRIHSQETKDKISILNIGEKNSFYGQHHSKETKLSISKAHKGKTWKLVNGKRIWMSK